MSMSKFTITTEKAAGLLYPAAGYDSLMKIGRTVGI